MYCLCVVLWSVYSIRLQSHSIKQQNKQYISQIMQIASMQMKCGEGLTLERIDESAKWPNGGRFREMFSLGIQKQRNEPDTINMVEWIRSKCFWNKSDIFHFNLDAVCAVWVHVIYIYLHCSHMLLSENCAAHTQGSLFILMFIVYQLKNQPY